MAEIPFLQWMTLASHTDASGNDVNQTTNRAIGDLLVGVRGWWHVSPVHLGAEAALGLPLGEQYNDQGLVTGDGLFHVVVSGMAIYTIDRLTLRGRLGYDLRTRGAVDALRYGLEAWGRVWGPMGAGIRVVGAYAFTPPALVAPDEASLTDAERAQRLAEEQAAQLGLQRVEARTLAVRPEMTCDLSAAVALRVFADVPLFARSAQDAPSYGLSFVVLH